MDSLLEFNISRLGAAQHKRHRNSTVSVSCQPETGLATMRPVATERHVLLQRQQEEPAEATKEMVAGTKTIVETNVAAEDVEETDSSSVEQTQAAAAAPNSKAES